MAGIQLGGLASGFDTTSMVEQLMNAERTKVDRIYQQKMMVEYKQKAYTAIADKYADFVIKTRDIFGISNNISSSGLTRPSTMNSLSWVNKATSSNNNVSAKASSAAQKGTYDIEVTQLADNVKIGSQENINIDSTASLKEQGIHVNITINGKTIEDTDGTMTLNDLVSEMNKVDGISASYDKTNGRVFLSTNETGSSNSITITENSSTDEDGNTITSNVLSSLKLNHQLESGVEAKGKDAIINFNGAEGLTFSSNEFTIQGLELSVTDLGKTRVTVSTDIDGIVGKVTEFVDAYNSLIDDIAKTLTESKYNDYPPLTDDQKKDMTEKEIELWEEKTKSGLLRSDSLIQSIQTSMRSMVNMEIDLGDGKKIRLSDLGITTKSYFEGGQNGALAIDEEKLRKSLTENPEDILQALFATPYDNSLNTSDRNLSGSQIDAKRSQSGLINRLSDVLGNGVSKLVQKAGVGADENKYRAINSYIMVDFVTSGSKSLLDNSITDYNKRIDRINAQLVKIEERYWKQFSAMETALSKMQSYSSMFSSM